jgi:hypothetical protein
MMTSTIKSLRPTVSRQEAVALFSACGVVGFFLRIQNGSLLRIADAYAPYWIYRVRYVLRKGEATRLFALDALDGSLDLFEFPKLPGLHELIAIETRNDLGSRLTEERAESLLREKVLRVLFQRGFFELREPHLEIVGHPVKLHMPYWVGFYDRRSTVHCRVIDAVRARVEGAKASALFEQWLAA